MGREYFSLSFFIRFGVILMDFEAVAIDVLFVCGIVISICFTVSFCMFFYVAIKEMFDKYEADKKKLYKRDFRES